MLLPEPRLEALVEQLKGLPRGDRRAILARLPVEQRNRVRARMHGAAERPWSPYSPDIAERIEAGDRAPMTAAARDALIRAARNASEAEPRATSLFDTLARFVGNGKKT